MLKFDNNYVSKISDVFFKLFFTKYDPLYFSCPRIAMVTY